MKETDRGGTSRIRTKASQSMARVPTVALDKRKASHSCDLLLHLSHLKQWGIRTCSHIQVVIHRSETIIMTLRWHNPCLMRPIGTYHQNFSIGQRSQEHHTGMNVYRTDNKRFSVTQILQNRWSIKINHSHSNNCLRFRQMISLRQLLILFRTTSATRHQTRIYPL